MQNKNFIQNNINILAKIGLIAKGVVYSLLGVMAFMAAFHLNGQSPSETDKEGVFTLLSKQTGGNILLITMAAGLLCYCIWRFIQAVADTDDKGSDKKGLATRARYLLSGLVYASLVMLIVKMLLNKNSDKGGGSNGMVEQLLSKPFGQWLVGILALIIVGIGVYQIYYGLSEKYHKHVNKTVNEKYRKFILGSGKLGYIARGIVWLIIGWLFAKAAYNSNSSEAGDSAQAFQFLAEASYGTYLLAAVGAGLICYGLFNFVRARYENFGNNMH